MNEKQMYDISSNHTNGVSVVPMIGKQPVANIEKRSDQQEDFFFVDGHNICQTNLTPLFILFFYKYVD